MRTTLCLVTALAVGGCITETRIIGPGGVPRAAVEVDDADTTAARNAKIRALLGRLDMPESGRMTLEERERNHGTTMYIVQQLIRAFPLSTKILIEEGVTHPKRKVRENAAFILGYSGDRAAEEALIAVLSDEVQSVRLSAAASLATGFGSKAGVPLLMRTLYHTSRHYRRQAVFTLRIFSQRYFAFEPDAPKARRDFAAGKWETWWRVEGDRFQAPFLGRRRPR